MKRITLKQPAYTDTDVMPFGDHKGKQMQHVPAEYLQRFKIAKSIDERLNNYVHNSWNAISQELKGK